jgi:hypothetical protein
MKWYYPNRKQSVRVEEVSIKGLPNKKHQPPKAKNFSFLSFLSFLRVLCASVVAYGKPLRVYVYLSNLFLGSP